MRWFVLLAVVTSGMNAHLGAAPQQSGEPSSASAETLPPDIDPESRNRLPRVRREDLDDRGKELFDSIVSDGRRLGLAGPSGIRMHSPRVSEYMSMGNLYLRFEAGIEPRLMELAILTVAREMDSQFEWSAHEPAGLRVGLEQSIIDVVKHRRPLAGLGEQEAAIIQLGREAFGRHRVETFARALRLFGRQGLVNIVSLMGHYSATAVLLTTFDQQLRPGQEAMLPVP